MGDHNNCTQIRAALLGFEFLHHVGAVRLAIDNMYKEGVSIRISVWSGRNGIKKQVEEVFPDTKFVDAGKLNHFDISEFGDSCKYETINYSKNYSELSYNEIRHLSYTLSRSHFMRQPQRASAKEVKLFNKWLDQSVKLLTKNGLSALFYTSLPHNIFDLTMAYAASRLNIPVIGLKVASFGDYMYAKPFLSESSNNATSVIDDEKVNESLSKPIPITEIREFLLSRKRGKGALKISYFDKALIDRLASIPACKFFRSSGFYNIDRYIKNVIGLDIYIFSRNAERVYTRVANILGRVYRMMVTYKKKSTIPANSRGLILVPLQWQPELTSSPSAYGTPFEDEILTALSKNFPGSLILAREHPSMLRKSSGSNYVRYRGPSFFKKIKKLENVVYSLPGNDDDYRDCIKAARCVVSITGTVAYEAVMLGTPAVHLGYSAAEGLTGLGVLRDIDELSSEMIDSLKSDLLSTSVDEIAKKYAESLNRYNPVAGFVTGFHEKAYTQGEYVNCAAIIFINMFRLGAKECQRKGRQ